MVGSAPSDARALLAQADLLLQCHMVHQAERMLTWVRLAPLSLGGWHLLARAQIASRRPV